MPGSGKNILSDLLFVVPKRFSEAAAQSFPFVLSALEEASVTDIYEQAMVFATVHHESGCGTWREEIWRDTKAQISYEMRSDLGNINVGDGYKFRGRGLVQLTGRKNYQLWSQRLGLDLAASPDLAAHYGVAATILVVGMKQGLFRKDCLSDFHKADGYDFAAARNIVNGDRDYFIEKLGSTMGAHMEMLGERYLTALQRHS